jgi:transcription elongation factor Elf1
MKENNEKDAFSMTCTICGQYKRRAKVVAKKGQRIFRICENCDQVGGKA